MKVAYFAESPADAAALTILTEAILARSTHPVTHVGLRQRGWPAVRTVLPAVLRQLHYHTDADGLVLVVDANGSPPHSSAHEQPGASDLQCRLCQLRRITDRVQSVVRLRPVLPPLKIAIGVATPSIEAWLLCGIDSRVSEAAWINGLRQNQFPYSKEQLKEWLYGTSRPSLAVELEAMKAAAIRLGTNLAAIEAVFPEGFGAFARSLRSW